MRSNLALDWRTWALLRVLSPSLTTHLSITKKGKRQTPSHRDVKLLIANLFYAGKSAIHTSFFIIYIPPLLKMNNVRLPKITLLQANKRTKDIITSLRRDFQCSFLSGSFLLAQGDCTSWPSCGLGGPRWSVLANGLGGAVMSPPGWSS